jgi:hypothetical protein
VSDVSILKKAKGKEAKKDIATNKASVPALSPSADKKEGTPPAVTPLKKPQDAPSRP